MARTCTPDSLWNLLRPLGHGESVIHRTARQGKVLRTRLANGWIVPTGTVAVQLRGQSYLAVVVEHFRAREVLAQHLDLVCDALTSARVPFRVLEPARQQPFVVVVEATQRGRALSALHEHLGETPTYVAAMAGRRKQAAQRLGRRAGGRPPKVVRVFRVLAETGGGVLSGDELGCDLEFWRVTRADEPAPPGGEARPKGSLIAPRRNRWTDVITPAALEIERRHIAGRDRPTVAAIRHPHLFDVHEPIDVVYTWVDGSDPDWVARKSAALRDRGVPVDHELSANSSRFTSRDELRYSLRSLESHADWVRHVYLVTDDQVPPWLQVGHPGLTVVNHRELFAGRGRLPTFNSHAIESQLHHIDGLSEHFLYLNDDVFFGRPVAPEQFFTGNGMALFHQSATKLGLTTSAPCDVPLMSAGKNNRELLIERFGRGITSKLQHVPHALRRSVLLDIERDFPEQVGETASAQFRSQTDLSIAASLAHYYGYATGRAVPGRLAYFYADIARDDTTVRLQSLLSKRAADVFCLNDHDSHKRDHFEQVTMIQQFLDAYFPLPSSFERGVESCAPPQLSLSVGPGSSTHRADVAKG
ncbi:MAG: stealth family protein [Terracoccus sp.]